MDKIIDKNEIVSQQPLPPLDITKYNHWSDYLYNLQVGHTELPGMTKDKSNEMGGARF